MDSVLALVLFLSHPFIHLYNATQSHLSSILNQTPQSTDYLFNSISFYSLFLPRIPYSVIPQVQHCFS